ncbi:MAG: hypothetical protein COB24_03315 [Hyphomicrobiales bacterium]|nr:MAG: hypothetical protein COB24_03315 [Hyphomicrobiales bacterium]
MIAEWIVFFSVIIFITMVGTAMAFANRNKNTPALALLRPAIYALTSASFLATAFIYRLYDLTLANGLSAIAIAIGPILLVGLGLPFIKRLAKIIRIQHIKSLPDFLSTRYGKKYSISILTTLLLLILAVPFIGVQIWYLNFSTDIVTGFIDEVFIHDHDQGFEVQSLIPVMATFKPVVILLLVFAGVTALRTTRNRTGTDGLVFVIAMTALATFVIMVAYFIYFTYVQFGGIVDVVNKYNAIQVQQNIASHEFSFIHIATILLLSTFAFIASPWQFQIIFAENSHDQELDVLRKTFVPFFAIFSFFAFFISLAAIVLFKGQYFDFALLSTAFATNAIYIGLFLYFASILATILLIIVELLAISTMISNDLILPLLIRNIGQDGFTQVQTEKSIALLKRVLIIFTLIMGYLSFIYFPYNGYSENLTYAANILLLQLAPPLVGGIYWDKATAKGLFAGVAAGLVMWLFTIGTPYFAQIGLVNSDILIHGLWGMDWLRPAALFGSDLNPNSHATIWSLGANILFFGIFSLAFKPDADEVVQNRLFSDVHDNIENPEIREWQKNTNLHDLQKMVGQYVGQDIAEIRFKRYAEKQGLPYRLNEFANIKFVKFARQQLAGAIGASSARFVMALVMERQKNRTSSTLKLLDEASELIHLNREVLQSAIDNINQGICVLDENLKLTSWNKAFLIILNIPSNILAQSSNFEVILEYCARRGDFGQGEISNLVAERILNYVVLKKTVRETIEETGQIIEVTSSAMPEGGCVITFDNVTVQVVATNELESVNANLEQRVVDRTDELTKLNDQLGKAKTEAEQANIDKTRFLAAASHDISQPMNAARLYSSALLEQDMSDKAGKIAQNLDLSLTSVEEILVALLDISRLDSGVYKAEMSDFGLNDLFEQLYIEFKPLADKQNLEFKYVATKRYIRSDRRHLRRILQNYISNAIKYTETGKVLFGCRPKNGQIRIDIYDTGQGVAPFQVKTIFKEFKRLESGMRVAQGVGLGLSIVDRISKMIASKIEVNSSVDEGSRFSCYVDVGKIPDIIPTRGQKPVVARNKLGPLNIVCIDNEAEILNALETLLGNWGVNGIYTETSKDALQEIEQRGIVPDAIIADYHLNFENGVFAIEKIRWQIDKPIKAILATADRSEQVVKVCQAKDITLMYKPLKPAILRAILARIDAENTVDT